MHYRQVGSEKDACSDWRDERHFSSPEVREMLLRPLGVLDDIGSTTRLDDVRCVLCTVTMVALAYQEYARA